MECLNNLNIIKRSGKLKKSFIFEFDRTDYKIQLHDKLHPKYEHLIS